MALYNEQGFVIRKHFWCPECGSNVTRDKNALPTSVSTRSRFIGLCDDNQHEVFEKVFV